MLERFKDIIKKEKSPGIPKSKIPKHIAITTEGKSIWAKKNNVEVDEAYKKSYLLIKSTIKLQIKNKIPILTFYLISHEIKDLEKFSILMDSIADFFKELATSQIIHDNKIKISVLGKWYDLPGRVVEPIKSAIDETKDYDSFFVNFCINYDGQEEIVSACKLIARLVKSEKIDIASINKELIKDNIYSSYFLPPDLVIKNGLKKEISSLLLWDLVRSKYYFSEKLWPDFDKQDFSKALDNYSKNI